MRVLVLKAPKETLDDGDPYVNALRSAGMDAHGVEVLSFQFVNQDVLKEKVSHPENYGGLVFTSPRGIVAIEQCLEGDTFDKPAWSSVPTYVVGDGTSKVLSEKFHITSTGQESGSAHQLAQFICKNLQNRFSKPLLFPSADLKNNILQNILHEAGILVDVVTSYKTMPHPHLNIVLRQIFCDNEDKPDALVFFSPSGVKAVLPHLIDFGVNLRICKLVAIGSTTEAALKEQGLNVFATATSPSPPGLVQSIKEAQNKIEL